MPCPPSLRVIALCCALLAAAAQAQTPVAPAAPAQPNGVPAAEPAPAAAAEEPAEQTAPPPMRPLTPVVGDRNGALSDSIPAEQRLWLEAGEDRFVARYQPDLSGLPRGAAIVLHDSGQHPSWPATVAALVDELPLHGWTVLAIELPAPEPDRSAAFAVPTPKPHPAQEQKDAAEQKEEPAAEPAAPEPIPAPPPQAAPVEPGAGPAAAAEQPEPPAPASARPELLERQAQARIQAALDHLINQRQRVVAVIGFGSGALRAAEFAGRRAAQNGAGDPSPVAALGLVAPLDNLPGVSAPLPRLLPATELPALDLALRNDNRARAEAEARRRAVLHQRGRDYLQLDLPPPNRALSATHSAVVKRVRGWLQQHVAAADEEEQPQSGSGPTPTGAAGPGR